MKGTQRELPTWLARLPLAPLWVVTGDEPLLIEEAVEAIRTAAQHHGFTQRECQVIDSPRALNALTITTESCSLFAEQRLLELRWQTPPSSKEEQKWLVALAKRTPQATVTIVILPPLDWRARQNSWYQTLCQEALVVETVAPGRTQLPHWWAERLAQQGQKASPTLLEWLAASSEGNLLAAKQQLSLLALLFPAGELPEEEVRATVASMARFDLFDLRLAVLTRDRERALRLVAALQNEGIAEPLLLWAISAALRALARASHLGPTASPAALDQLARQERLFTAEEKEALRQATRLSAAQTRRWLLAAARLDLIAKGAIPSDFWQEAERLLIALLAQNSRHFSLFPLEVSHEPY